MTGLVWGLLSIGFRAFFRDWRGECGDRVPRPGPAVRSLGQREMSVSEALSRSKPPEAVAEGQPLQGLAHRRPSLGEIEGPRACPSEDFVVVGMRQLLMRVDLDGSRSGPGRTPPIAAAAAFDVLVLPGAPKTGLGAFSFGLGLDFPPFLIRSEASLYEAQAEGLHARIRRSSGNSQPLCLIREARRPGTEGAGPILAAACCSHSPARRPAHLGGFSGSVWISFPCLIHETLNRASQRALAPRLTRRPGARPRE